MQRRAWPTHNPTASRRSVVHVNARRRGGWHVSLPEGSSRVACESLDEARQVAYRSAAHHGPCELIVHDAYHRVLERELIDVKSGSAAA